MPPTILQKVIKPFRAIYFIEGVFSGGAGGVGKMIARGKRTVRKNARKKRPVFFHSEGVSTSMANRKKITGKKPFFQGRGIATNAIIKGQTIGVTAQRPIINITKERGANVRVRTVGPKRKTIYV